MTKGGLNYTSVDTTAALNTLSSSHLWRIKKRLSSTKEKAWTQAGGNLTVVNLIFIWILSYSHYLFHILLTFFHLVLILTTCFSYDLLPLFFFVSLVLVLSLPFSFTFIPFSSLQLLSFSFLPLHFLFLCPLLTLSSSFPLLTLFFFLLSLLPLPLFFLLSSNWI